MFEEEYIHFCESFFSTLGDHLFYEVSTDREVHRSYSEYSTSLLSVECRDTRDRLSLICLHDERVKVSGFLFEFFLIL